MSLLAKLTPGSAAIDAAGAAAATAHPRRPGPALKWSQWVPVRALHERHRSRIRQHLLALSDRDRYLRFGYSASDRAIEQYVAALDFSRDQLFGIFNRRLRLMAISHVAYADDGAPFAEFAVSVAAAARGRGYGKRLFRHAALHARNRGVHRMLIHALSENVTMLRIAEKAGATVQRDGGESEAWLQLPPDSLASHLEALLGTRAAELNYGVKFEGRRWARLETRLLIAVRRWFAR